MPHRRSKFLLAVFIALLYSCVYAQQVTRRLPAVTLVPDSVDMAVPRTGGIVRVAARTLLRVETRAVGGKLFCLVDSLYGTSGRNVLPCDRISIRSKVKLIQEARAGRRFVLADVGTVDQEVVLDTLSIGVTVFPDDPAGLYASRVWFVTAEGDTEAVLKLRVELLERNSEVKTAQEKWEQSVWLEIDGLIVDRTRSKLGRDFYKAFYKLWRPPPGVSDFMLTVRDKPYPRGTTLVSVEINNVVVARAVLRPRALDIERIAERIILLCQNFLRNYEANKRLLEGDDMVGSGIY